MIVSVAVAGSTCKTVGPGTHLDVETVEDSFFAVATSAPVADNHSVKSPVILEDVHEKLLVMTVVLTVVKIV